MDCYYQTFVSEHWYVESFEEPLRLWHQYDARVLKEKKTIFGIVSFTLSSIFIHWQRFKSFLIWKFYDVSLSVTMTES